VRPGYHRGTVRGRFALLLPLALLAFGSAGAEGPSRTPGASATAWAIRISLPSGSVGTATVSSPPNGAPSAGAAFSYPSNGSVVSVGSTTASAVTAVTQNASATAESVVTSLSLFGGEVTADAVSGRASAGTGSSGAGGNANGSGVVNLRVGGQAVAPGISSVALGGWGELTIGSRAVDRSAPPGARGYRGTVIELEVRLGSDHGGLPASSEIRVGYAEAVVQTALRGAFTGTAHARETVPPGTGNPRAGDAPQLFPRQVQPAPRAPLKLHPKLATAPYVFPVYGASSYADTFGAARSDVTYHHGDDIFGQLGQPLVACVDGTVFSVGWNKVGGNRLWILDSQGNQFYYAHLSAFAAAATDGAHVKAGQVVGFMGDTGDAEGTPYHLHFEVHPVSLLYLGYDGAVDPTGYLDAWPHEQDLPFPVAVGWVPVVHGRPPGPEPGAILLGMNDISSADGLDPASLARSLAPLAPSALMQTLVPSVLTPTADLGRG